MIGSKLIREILALAIGGGIGSVLRFLLSRWVQGRTETHSNSRRTIFPFNISVLENFFSQTFWLNSLIIQAVRLIFTGNRRETQYFPRGILTVNLLGCLLIGILFGILVERFNRGPLVRSGIFLGILGSFTSFSSFSMDAITLFYSGAYGTARVYILLSVVAGILATGLGLSLVRIIL